LAVRRPRREEDLRRALTAALVGGQEPDPRTAALVALLHAVGRAHKSVPHEGMSGAAVRARAKEISQGAWAAKAVKDAITAAQAAVIAATAASTAAASSG
jgi:Golgi phosphoprotein 3 GPP34